MPETPPVCPERAPAVDLAAETLISFTNLARKVSKAVPTVHRWATIGVLPPRATQRILLESLRIGAVKYTSLEAWSRFVERINAPEPGDDREVPSVTTEARRRELERVDAGLNAAGF